MSRSSAVGTAGVVIGVILIGIGYGDVGFIILLLGVGGAVLFAALDQDERRSGGSP